MSKIIKLYISFLIIFLYSCNKTPDTPEKSYYEQYKEKVGIKDTTDYERLKKENSALVEKKFYLKEKYEKIYYEN